MTSSGDKHEGRTGGRLRKLLNLPSSSILARLYYLLSLCMTLLYLACLALSTLPSFREYQELEEGPGDSPSPGFVLHLVQLSCVAFSGVELCVR